MCAMPIAAGPRSMTTHSAGYRPPAGVTRSRLSTAARAKCLKSASAPACRFQNTNRTRERVAAEKLTNVAGLHEMDAGNLQFPDASFDMVVAMYVITVVPDPEKVMRELARVVKPGGEVMLVNHFSQDDGVRGWVERRMAPFADLVGWHSVFNDSRVMVCDDLKLIDRRALRPWGLFTMMRFRKEANAGRHQLAAE